MQEPRQLYGLGSLVKKITRPIKKVLKSPIGKAAAIGLGGYALGGGFGPGGFAFNKIPGFLKAKNFMLGAPQDFGRSAGFLDKLKGLGTTKGILGIGAGAGLLGGLLAKGEEETEEEYQDRIVRLQPYLRQYYSNVGDTFGDQALSPGEVEDFVTSQSIEYQGAKDGGIIGAEVDEMKVGPKGEEEIMEEEVVEQDDMSEPMTGIEKVADSLRDIAMVLYKVNPTIMPYKMAKAMYDRLPDISKQHVDDTGRRMTEPEEDEVSETMIMVEGKKDGGIMNLGGKEMDLRGGGFVPLGKKERADDVPARLSKNEFVFTADAVRAAGGGSVQKGAQKMYDTMKMLEKRIK